MTDHSLPESLSADPERLAALDLAASEAGDMVVESTMVPLGTSRPTFALLDVDGAPSSSTELSGSPALVCFLCNQCPSVRHIEARQGGRFVPWAEHGWHLHQRHHCLSRGRARPAEQSTRAGWKYPYLVDSRQQVGREFAAACTPDFFLYDADGKLAYRGAFDDSTPGNGLPITGELLADAIRRTFAGEPVPEPHRPSMGGSIKWRT